MHRTKRRAALTTVAVAVAVALTGTTAGAAPQAPSTERITLSNTGEQGTSHAGGPYLSANGRYAAFESEAPNLVPGDTNGVADTFVRDLRTGRVERISVASDGTQADSGTGPAAISANGRYVVLVSTADNLRDWPAPKEYWARDVYVHDRVTGRTEWVSTTPDGGSAYAHGGAEISDDGRYVAFNARPNRMEAGQTVIYPAVYVTDRRTGTVERVTNGDHPSRGSYHLDMSADGRYVAYNQNEPRGGGGALLVHDRRTGAEERVDVTPEGTPGQYYGLDPSLSADGRHIAFTYRGDDLVPDGAAVNTGTYVRDLRTDTTRGIVHDGTGGPAVIAGPQISRDGRHVAYGFRAPQGHDNIYVRDLRTGTSSLASESATGGPVTDGDVYATSFGGGKLLGLGSASAQLVSGDTNGVTDGFVRRLR
ncbi:TolB family protein [Streptomyces bicolor]|uniref:TolB family protein n=1 Tax=Streptomyces bicolor TaxID=66874 RepID=UPI0004E12416|nr:PD40 domain-containing protein [Streptomyces bicolor]